ncbi:integrase catalytic domain-containing protein [Trichonephila clavata]|uniref:Integrase catalytic domain-containing protein n=1 Tax=Trichonephila clavata TaxID=2740835 RepID=A0A8X6G017_TRICU|nr:integrase catalytic domain-containing protein [Trichonephila clavata]
MGKIGATADIRKTFLSISLDDHDRDYMRFIWWKDGDPEKEIRTLSDPERWDYVSDSLIPSDLPSRGCNVEALSISRWWEGPAYLQKPMNKWPRSEKLPNFEIINSERRKTLISVTNTDNKKIDWPLARVIQLFPSKDGDVRLTKVKMKNGEFLRPIKIGLYPWSCLLNWMPPRTYDPDMDYYGKNEFEFFELEKLKGGRMLYLCSVVAVICPIK